MLDTALTSRRAGGRSLREDGRLPQSRADTCSTRNRRQARALPYNPPALTTLLSSRGLGRSPLTALTPVRIRVGAPPFTRLRSSRETPPMRRFLWATRWPTCFKQASAGNRGHWQASNASSPVLDAGSCQADALDASLERHQAAPGLGIHPPLLALCREPVDAACGLRQAPPPTPPSLRSPCRWPHHCGNKKRPHGAGVCSATMRRGQAVTVASLSIFCSSPDWKRSSVMSQPPISSPFTYSCGKVGQLANFGSAR